MKYFSILKIYPFFALLSILFMLVMQACETDPGEGGTSFITGKVYVKEINGSGLVTAEYYAPDERVYILYDADDIYDEETRTSFNGMYQFKYLRKGIYRIYAYSDVSIVNNFQEPVIVEVEITENHQEVTAPEIVIERR
ncbi:MAG: hypothetical protein H7X71_08740 [Chitinophagales bacterium]|nr:hypothetical protein [Chitinophagales bacterium]